MWCAYCGVKNGGKGLLKVWVTSMADHQDIREERNEHDRLYHLRWWNRA
jgi:hypothetical protein